MCLPLSITCIDDLNVQFYLVLIAFWRGQYHWGHARVSLNGVCIFGFSCLQRGLLSSQDVLNAQERVGLAVTSLTGVSLSALLLVDDNFLGLLLLLNGGQNLGAGDHGLSDDGVVSASDHEDLVEEDGSLDGDVDFVNHDMVALSDFKL